MTIPTNKHLKRALTILNAMDDTLNTKGEIGGLKQRIETLIDCVFRAQADMQNLQRKSEKGKAGKN